MPKLSFTPLFSWVKPVNLEARPLAEVTPAIPKPRWSMPTWKSVMVRLPDSLLKPNTSAPVPPVTVSLPPPPMMVSRPEPPVMFWLPASPLSRTAVSPSNRTVPSPMSTAASAPLSTKVLPAPTLPITMASNSEEVALPAVVTSNTISLGSATALDTTPGSPDVGPAVLEPEKATTRTDNLMLGSALVRPLAI